MADREVCDGCGRSFLYMSFNRDTAAASYCPLCIDKERHFEDRISGRKWKAEALAPIEKQNNKSFSAEEWLGFGHEH